MSLAFVLSKKKIALFCFFIYFLYHCVIMEKVTVNEFAKKAGVSDFTVYQWVKKGLIFAEIKKVGFVNRMKISLNELKKIPSFKKTD